VRRNQKTPIAVKVDQKKEKGSRAVSEGPLQGEKERERKKIS